MKLSADWIKYEDQKRITADDKKSIIRKKNISEIVQKSFAIEIALKIVQNDLVRNQLPFMTHYNSSVYAFRLFR